MWQGRSQWSSGQEVPSPLPIPPSVSPTKIEAFVLVFRVEEDTLGVRVDVSACCYEHCCDVSLASLNSDVQRRLPCEQSQHERSEAWDNLS